MSYIVSANDPGKIILSQKDPVANILQNICMILRTRQLSCPLYREFGLPMRFVDRPFTVARSILMVEVKEAVEQFEPRAEVVNVELTEDPGFPGKMFPTVEVIIHE